MDKSRGLLTLDGLAPEVVLALLARAQEMASGWAARRMPQVLAGRRVALIVDDGGWRNTTAFELGITAMGGQCVRAPVTLGGREAVADLAAYLDNWVDGVVIRSPELAAIAALAAAARAPVINARTRVNHSCETLGDLAYLFARHGGLRPMKVAVVAPAANILGSWIEAAAVLPVEVVQIYPTAWHAISDVPRFRVATDMGELADAAVVVTDRWPDNGAAERLLPYQVTSAVLDAIRPDASFLPCPPVTRGQEVTAAAMTHRRCDVVAAKAFLLHAQNALLEWSMGK